MQFHLRAAMIATVFIAVYLALAKTYGFGRAIFCWLNLGLGISSLMFFATAFYSYKEQNSRNALGAGLLGMMVLLGSMLAAALVFQPSMPG